MKIISIYSITNGFKISALATLIILAICCACWMSWAFLDDGEIIHKILSATLLLLTFIGCFFVARFVPDYYQNKYGYYVEIIDEDNVDISNYNIIEVHGNLYRIEDK